MEVQFDHKYGNNIMACLGVERDRMVDIMDGASEEVKKKFGKWTAVRMLKELIEQCNTNNELIAMTIAFYSTSNMFFKVSKEHDIVAWLAVGKERADEIMEESQKIINKRYPKGSESPILMEIIAKQCDTQRELIAATIVYHESTQQMLKRMMSDSMERITGRRKGSNILTSSRGGLSK